MVLRGTIPWGMQRTNDLQCANTMHSAFSSSTAFWASMLHYLKITSMLCRIQSCDVHNHVKFSEKQYPHKPELLSLPLHSFPGKNPVLEVTTYQHLYSFKYWWYSWVKMAQKVGHPMTAVPGELGSFSHQRLHKTLICSLISQGSLIPSCILFSWFWSMQLMCFSGKCLFCAK